MLEIAIAMEKKAGRPAKMVDDDAAKNPMKIVAQYVVSKIGIRSIFDLIDDERQRVLILPQIQGLRDKAVAEMIRDNASRRIQRIFRGFLGRSQILRMTFRVKQENEQARIVVRKRMKMSEKRLYRAMCVALVQGRIKGILWRRRLARMQGASVVIQTIYRGFMVRQAARAAQRRKFEGAKVDLVYKRGTMISKVHLFLTVHRCGLSFKLTARSEEHMDTFFGYVYREETLKLLEFHNKKLNEANERYRKLEEEEEAAKYVGYDKSKDSLATQQTHAMQQMLNNNLKVIDEDHKEVKLWQYERILKVMIANLALVDPIKSSSFEMQKLEGTKVIVCDLKYGNKANGFGILKFNGQKRILKDQKKAIVRYERNLKRTQTRQEAHGLPIDQY